MSLVLSPPLLGRVCRSKINPKHPIKSQEGLERWAHLLRYSFSALSDLSAFAYPTQVSSGGETAKLEYCISPSATGTAILRRGTPIKILRESLVQRWSNLLPLFASRSLFVGDQNSPHFGHFVSDLNELIILGALKHDHRLNPFAMRRKLQFLSSIRCIPMAVIPTLLLAPSLKGLIISLFILALAYNPLLAGFLIVFKDIPFLKKAFLGAIWVTDKVINEPIIRGYARELERDLKSIHDVAVSAKYLIEKTTDVTRAQEFMRGYALALAQQFGDSMTKIDPRTEEWWRTILNMVLGISNSEHGKNLSDLIDLAGQFRSVVAQLNPQASPGLNFNNFQAMLGLPVAGHGGSSVQYLCSALRRDLQDKQNVFQRIYQTLPQNHPDYNQMASDAQEIILRCKSLEDLLDAIETAEKPDMVFKLLGAYQTQVSLLYEALGRGFYLWILFSNQCNQQGFAFQNLTWENYLGNFLPRITVLANQQANPAAGNQNQNVAANATPNIVYAINEQQIIAGFNAITEIFGAAPRNIFYKLFRAVSLVFKPDPVDWIKIFQVPQPNQQLATPVSLKRVPRYLEIHPLYESLSKVGLPIVQLLALSSNVDQSNFSSFKQKFLEKLDEIIAYTSPDPNSVNSLLAPDRSLGGAGPGTSKIGCQLTRYKSPTLYFWDVLTSLATKASKAVEKKKS